MGITSLGPCGGDGGSPYAAPASPAGRYCDATRCSSARSARAAGRVPICRFPRYPAGGANGSHRAALVEIGDEVVFASVHGEGYVDAAVQMAVDLAIRAER
jgi:hypothetical protein